MGDAIDLITGTIVAAAAIVFALLTDGMVSLFFIALISRLAWLVTRAAREDALPDRPFDLLRDVRIVADLCIVFMAVWVGEASAGLIIDMFDLDPLLNDRLVRMLVMLFAYLGPEGILALLPKAWGWRR